MLKNITNTLGTLLEVVETLTEKTGAIAIDALDIVGTEVEISLDATIASKPSRLKQAKAEDAYELEKAEKKLDAKKSALDKVNSKRK